MALLFLIIMYRNTAHTTIYAPYSEMDFHRASISIRIPRFCLVSFEWQHKPYYVTSFCLSSLRLQSPSSRIISWSPDICVNSTDIVLILEGYLVTFIVCIMSPCRLNKLRPFILRHLGKQSGNIGWFPVPLSGMRLNNLIQITQAVSISFSGINR